MNHFWDKGALFVRELRELYPEPQPHFNTLSTQVRELEQDGFLDHKAYGPTYQYLLISKAATMVWLSMRLGLTERQWKVCRLTVF